MGVLRPAEGNEDEDNPRKEKIEARLLAENHDGDEDGDGNFQVVEDGQGGRIDPCGPGIPEEEAEAGSDCAKVGESGPLGSGEAGQFGNGILWQGEGKGRENPPEVEKGVKVAVRALAEGAVEMPVEHLAGGKAEIGELDEKDAGGFSGEAPAGQEYPSCPSNRKEGGVPEPGGWKTALDESMGEDHVEGSEDGQQGHLMPVEVAESVEKRDVHESVLEGPGKDEFEGKGIKAAETRFEEGKKAGKREEEAGEGEGGSAEAGKLCFDKPERESPQKGDREQVEHDRPVTVFP